MERYANTSGRSNVAAYEIGPTWIDVRFHGSTRIYRYSYDRAGASNVEAMKRLARLGSGLNSFIMRRVRFLYD